MNEHTPTPWAYQEKSDAYTHIVRSGDRFIFQLAQDTSGEAESTARLIVKAVNSHDALVKALQQIADSPCSDACGNSDIASAVLASIKERL